MLFCNSHLLYGKIVKHFKHRQIKINLADDSLVECNNHITFCKECNRHERNRSRMIAE